MNKENIFSIWAPEESTWSRWAKPVLFAHLGGVPSPISAPDDAGWAPPVSDRVALVLDLPGVEGVLAGLALAGRGYRPVPLYNALPRPFGTPETDPLTGRSVAAVELRPVINALTQGAELLARLNLASDAPPVFLLDADRRGDGRKMEPEEFDNRSVCFTTDFPSANFLLARGIQRVLVVQKSATVPHSDLAHILRRWQDGGLTLERMRADFPGKPERFEVARPPWFGAMFQRVLAGFGLRRSGSGGFGDWVPDSASVG